MARETSEACFRLLKALADETRWKIIRELIANPATVHDLSVRLKATQYNVSKHLRILRESGIVTAKRTGKYIWFVISQKNFDGGSRETKTNSTSVAAPFGLIDLRESRNTKAL